MPIPMRKPSSLNPLLITFNLPNPKQPTKSDGTFGYPIHQPLALILVTLA
jgi:hypothetical protein